MYGELSYQHSYHCSYKNLNVDCRLMITALTSYTSTTLTCTKKGQIISAYKMFGIAASDILNYYLFSETFIIAHRRVKDEMIGCS